MDSATNKKNGSTLEEQGIRVRYSRPDARREWDGFYCKGSPRNTLVTRQHENYIYFGIAYCNTNEDVVSKKKGRKIALDRLFGAESFDVENEEECGIWINKEGTLGFCRVEFITTILDFFGRK